jgi:hypothetical protein
MKLKRTLGTFFLIVGLSVASAPASAISFGAIGYGAERAYSNVQGQKDERDGRSTPDMTGWSKNRVEGYYEGVEKENTRKSNEDYDKRKPPGKRNFSPDKKASYDNSTNQNGGVGNTGGFNGVNGGQFN